MRAIEGQIGKKEEDFFTTAKRYLFDNPEALKNMMLKDFDKEKMN